METQKKSKQPKNVLPPIEEVKPIRLPDGTAAEFMAEVKLPESVNVLTVSTNNESEKKELTQTENTQVQSHELTQQEIAKLAIALNIPVEAVEKLQNMNAEEATKQVEYAAHVRRSGTKKDMPKFAILPLPADTKVMLSDLKALDEFDGIRNAKTALRSINPANVESLRFAYARNAASVPKLKLFNSTQGIGIIAGHHRQAAMLKGLRMQCEDNTGKLTEEGKKKYLALVANTPVNFEPINGLTAAQIRDMAFMDNIDHGLGVSQDSRSRYVLTLQSEAIEDGRKFNMLRTCERIGVSRQAVDQMKKRDIKAALKTVPDVRSSDDYTKLDESEKEHVGVLIAEVEKELAAEKDTADKKDPLNDACEKIIPLFAAIKTECDKFGLSSEGLADYFTRNKYIDSVTDLDTMAYITGAFVQIKYTEDQLSDLAK